MSEHDGTITDVEPNEAADSAAAGQVNRSAAEVYEEFFVPALFGQWPDQVLDAIDAGPGHDLLDVGCGTGIVARAAAARVGADGSVAGVDLNDGMLAVARRAEPSIAWHHGPAEQLPFSDDSFDRTVSQFALMFFSDRAAAVAEMARVTRPGGTVGLVTWAALDQSPGYAAMVDLLRRLFGDQAAEALSSPYNIGTEAELVSVVGDVLPNPSVARLEGEARFDSIEAWVHTDVRGWTLADMIDDDQYRLLLDAAEKELAGFVEPGGRVRFSAPALVATATI
jgi:SAM-dependent methyltransferase